MKKKYIERLMILSVFWGALSLFGQDVDQKGTKIEAGTSLEDHIQYLQKRIPDLIKKLQIDDRKEIVFNIGQRYNMGGKIKYVFVEKVLINVSSSGVSLITFVYDRTNEITTYKEVREISNSNPSDREMSGLVIRFKSSRGDANEFDYNQIQDPAQKAKILRTYLDSLNDFVRWLDYYDSKSGSNEKKSIQKALRLSSV